jgi:DNA modification methylase
MICGDARDPAVWEKLLGDVKINVVVTSPPYASQRKYDPSSGFKPIPPDEYGAWFEPIQAAIAKHLADDGSYFLNIKEASSAGCKETYVKRLLLSHIDAWGWNWIEEFCWPRPAMPLNPNTSRRFKNGWEVVFHFSIGTGFAFYPDDVRHESDGVFTYADQKAAGKMIGGTALGVGGSIMSPVNAGRGLAFPSNVLNNMGGANVVGHSAAYPVGLPEFFINAYTDAGDVVLDPFTGSGSTLIAAEKTGRVFYGIEISPGYCDVIRQRYANYEGT